MSGRGRSPPWWVSQAGCSRENEDQNENFIGNQTKWLHLTLQTKPCESPDLLPVLKNKLKEKDFSDITTFFLVQKLLVSY